MLFEYRIPGMSGLVATLAYQFSGTRAANDANSFFAPGYNLVDLGARYTSAVWSRPVTWRLSVDNVQPTGVTGRRSGRVISPAPIRAISLRTWLAAHAAGVGQRKALRTPRPERRDGLCEYCVRNGLHWGG